MSSAKLMFKTVNSAIRRPEIIRERVPGENDKYFQLTGTGIQGTRCVGALEVQYLEIDQ